ncbi:hypothetical protein ACFPRL_10640 [Pseudoclavibacter helvolus]
MDAADAIGTASRSSCRNSMCAVRSRRSPTSALVEWPTASAMRCARSVVPPVARTTIAPSLGFSPACTSPRSVARMMMLPYT